jgi:ferredoxin-NAD(P)+ reductase (naphthalene dioxygenase ferredoxin-specific)
LADLRCAPIMPAMEVLIQPLHKVIDVEPGVNLLQALHEAQVPMSHSCMAGRCGTCRCRVIDGEVLDAGSAEQNPLDGRDSYVLACQSYLTEPCTIEIPASEEVVVHPAWSVKAKVLRVERLADDVRRVVLSPARPIRFSPGQHARLEFGPGLARTYSMAGMAADAELEFHVRILAGGRTSKHVAEKLTAGDAVRVSGPLGNAYLRDKHPGPMLCVAGGTGLAPILSIVRGAVAKEMPNPIHLYVGARSAREVYGLDALYDLQRSHPTLKLQVVVTSGDAPEGQRRGLVTEAIAQDLGDLQGWAAYLCGSPPMVEAAALLARQKGIDATRIYTQAFYTQLN